MQNPHAKGPGQADLDKIRGKLSGTPEAHPTTSQKPKPIRPEKPPEGGGGRGKKPAPKAKLEDSEPAPEPLDMTGEDAPKADMKAPKAVLKKIGWVDPETRFNTDAPVFAEFAIPESEKNRTLVDFQLWEDKDGEYVIAARAQGHVDETGKAQAAFPIRKGDNPETTFALKAKHCSGEFPDEPSADRVVTESAAISC